MRYFLILLTVGVFVLSGRLIKVDSIICTSQFGVCRQSIVDDLSKAIPDSLSQSKKSIKSVLDASLYVGEYSLRFMLPSKLKIDVLEVDPSFALKSDEVYALVDDKGVVLTIVEKVDLPHVVIPNQVPDVGDIVGEKELFSLELVKKLFDTRGVSEVNLEDEGLEAALTEGVMVIFPTDGIVDDLVTTLDILIFKLNNGSLDLRIEDVDEIDLRFKNPIFREY